MLIRCPECQFERDINTDAIPASATMATCPRCGQKFRFREPGAASGPEDGRPEPQGQEEWRDQSEAGQGGKTPQGRPAQSQEGDDPLPPGAVIPHMDNDDSETSVTSGSGKPAAGRFKGASRPQDIRPRGDAPQVEEPRRGLFEALRRPDMDESSALEVPWERIDLYGYLGGFYHTVLRVLFRGPEFFTHIRSANTPVRALIFFVLRGLYQIITANLLFATLPQVEMPPPQAEAMLNSTMGPQALPMLLLLTPFVDLVKALLLAGLYHLMIRLAQPDKADFAVTLRVICYSAAPYVVTLVPLLGHMVALPWFVACTFIGCKYALNLSWSRTTLALAPLFILGLAMLQFVFATMFHTVG